MTAMDNTCKSNVNFNSILIFTNSYTVYVEHATMFSIHTNCYA